jgi:quercetin dioxygenase-like cupin family protein
MKFHILVAATIASCANAFVPSRTNGTPRTHALSMTKKIIDMSNIETTDDDGPLSDGINPKAMGVARVKEIAYPQDIAERKLTPKITEPKIFEFNGKSKIDKHSHPGSGQYFVTNGKITVSTADEKKTYEKGDMFIVPKDLEYDLENEEEEDVSIFYVYWSPEPL